jgi:hypothetical protein
MKNGLKGVTDATVFCKSMQKGGSASMIKSMKSYEVGGATDDSCMETFMDAQGRPKRRRRRGGCHAFNKNAVDRSVRRAQNRPRNW